MSINQEAVLGVIFEVLNNLNLERDPENQVPVGIDTVLFGGTSLLDSLALVSVIADVEMGISDFVGEPVTLMDDRALNQERSPFTNVRSLCDYILQLTAGKA